MVVLPPQGASDTYGQLPDTGADTIRAPRHGFARVNSTVKRMSIHPGNMQVSNFA